MSHQQNPTNQQDEEYDVYLFWPSLSSRDVSAGPGDTPSSPLYGPVSLESTDDEYSGFSSGPPSPITFVSNRDFPSRFPVEPDFGAAPSGSPEVGPSKEPKTVSSGPAKYSSLFKLGLCLSQMNRFINRAIEGVKLKTRKPRSQAS